MKRKYPMKNGFEENVVIFYDKNDISPRFVLELLFAPETLFFQ